MRPLLWFILLMHGLAAWAQLELSSSGATYTIDFESTVSGVSNGLFDGGGFSPTPGIGQLDSDAWEILGCSDGDLYFGATNTTGDLARGSSTGGEADGGIYSFEVATGNHALGFQPSGADLTPGSITLRLENATGSMITRLQIDYGQFIYNDQPRANSVSFAFSYDNSTWVYLDTITSSATADPSPSWNGINISETVGVVWPNNTYLYIRWHTDDESGSGARDEFAIDDIAVTPTTSTEWVYINEIMVDPDIDQNGDPFVGDGDAEWFELNNPLTYPIYLDGLIMEDGAGSFNIDELTISAQDSIVLGRSDNTALNGGYQCDHVYTGFLLNNTGDQLSLLYPDNSILDEVDFNSWTLLSTGASMRFTGLPADDNNLETNWIVSTTRGGSYVSGQPSSDRGTPGTFSSVLLSHAFVLLQTYAEPEGIRIMWKVNDDKSYTYQLEQSQDGQHFQVLTETKALEWRHTTPSLGKNYYRVKGYDANGLAYTSSIVWEDWLAFDFYCYPNPSPGVFTILQRGEATVDWLLEMYDMRGRLVFSASWRSEGENSTFSGHLSLPSGRYRVVLREPSGGVRWSTSWQVID